jgi:protoheme IX farnesyltransferase
MLCRAGVALFTACSAVTGYLAAGGSAAANLGWLAAGTLVLAGGASALNQYQERDIDARMARTSRRPVPAGALSPRHALALSSALLIAGLLALSPLGASAPALGAFALIWYNGLYTALKRRTAFAAVYGAVIGAVPPAIGWTAAGGSLADPGFLALGALFLLWQVPHFWLLLLRREADYRAAGLPALTDLFGAVRLGRITLLWTFAAATVPLLLPLFGIVRSPVIAWSLLPVLVLTVALVLRSLRHPASPASFRWINAFLAVVMALLSLDPLFRRMG